MRSLTAIATLGLALMACTSTQQNNTDQPEGNDRSTVSQAPDDSVNTDQQSARWNEQRTRGVDFLALGNEPAWSLEIDFDNRMHFKSLTQMDSISIPVPEAEKEVSETRYQAETEDGKLIVTITQQNCSDAMSSEEFPYTVTVQVKTGEMSEADAFSGCGLYLGDYRLNDIWVLEAMDGEEIDPTQFPRERPMIEIHLAEQKLYGFAGCNSINGNIAFGKESLQVGPLISTKMSCPMQDFEQRFTQVLSEQPLDYTLENGKLILKNQNRQLVFKKVD